MTFCNPAYKGAAATMESAQDNPILVTGAAGDIGGIGRNLTAMPLAKGHKVRALVRREDERSEGLRQLGADVVQGDLTDLTSMHRAIEGCARIYFGMSISAAYLEARVNGVRLAIKSCRTVMPEVVDRHQSSTRTFAVLSGRQSRLYFRETRERLHSLVQQGVQRYGKLAFRHRLHWDRACRRRLRSSDPAPMD